MAYQKFGHHDSSFIADTIDDLKDLPKNSSMGSTCYVISNATKYPSFAQLKFDTAWK